MSRTSASAFRARMSEITWRTTVAYQLTEDSEPGRRDVRYINPHAMRRTCGSLLAALDVHPRVAMRILRHSKILITMEIYAEVPDEATRDALRRLGAQLDS